jgi:hypothetical protein
MTTEPPPPGSVSPAIRWFVRIFLAAFVVCSVFGFEVFPLTGFRLFSHVRPEVQVVWEADTVEGRGVQERLWFEDLPRAYQGFPFVVRGFTRLPADRKLAMCEAWLSQARRVEHDASALHIYREDWKALPRLGDRSAAPTHRILAYACS